MATNYQFERASVAATGATPVTLLAAPPAGVSYRIFYVNGYNDSGGARSLIGNLVSTSPSLTVRCFTALVANNTTFVYQRNTFALAEYPTIAVLDDTDEIFQIFLNAAGTMTISVCYEIVDQTGERTFRNALATTNGTTGVELIPAPTSETVHRVLSANGLNNSGGTRNLYLDATTGSPTQRLVELQAVNNAIFRTHLVGSQSPFPPFILSSTSDSCVMSLGGTGALPIAAFYEVLDRRVV